MTWLDDNAAWLDRARARWAPRKPEPLRLRIWFSSPIAYDGRNPLTLEGLLQFVVVRRETGRSPDDVFANIPQAGDADVQIPIVDETIAGLPIARCSVGWWPSSAVEALRFRRKRADPEQYGLNKVMINGGPYKALNIPVATIVTPYLDFWIDGDRKLLDELLLDAGGLGRDSPRGLGSVLGWEWSEDQEARALLHRGVPMRALPLVEDGSAYDVRRLSPGSFDERIATTRAPYWIQRRARMCVVPVQTVGEESEAA